MSIVRRALVAALIGALVVLPRAAAPAHADDPDVNGAIAQQRAMQDELARQRDQLAKLLGSQASLSASLDQISGDLDSVGLAIQTAADQLVALGEQLESARQDLASYRRQISSLAEDLGTVEQQIVANQADLAARERLLQAHLRDVYAESQVSILEVILSSRSFTDVAGELGDMLSVSDQDRMLASQIRVARQQLDVRLGTLRDGRSQLASLEQQAADRAAELATQEHQLAAARATLDAREADLRRLQAEQEGQLAAAVRNADAYRQKIAEQEAAIAGQAELVARLKADADKLDVAYHGRFAWPLIGRFVVTQEFGPTVYESFHTGIDMAYLSPICGGPIYAAADGVVLADGRPNAAYGDTAIGVIIGHSQRLQTWYWHLSREIVSVGEEVRAGDLIGYEGATGWATGCHLHFQVMFDGSAVNPRQYLP